MELVHQLALILATWLGFFFGSRSAHRYGRKPAASGSYKLSGGMFMKTYAGDRPADVIKFKPGQAVDSEGTALPADKQPALSYQFSSDDESIAKVEQLNADDPNELTVSYGTPKKLDDNSYAVATVKAESNEITLPDGTVVRDVLQEQIQLVPGELAGFVGGALNFPEA